MKKVNKIVVALIVCLSLISLVNCRQKSTADINLERAQQTLDCLYTHYSIEKSSLLYENYPHPDNYAVTYMAAGGQSAPINYSYLWSYIGTFSAANVLLEVTNDNKYLRILENNVLTGLEEYFDPEREPHAYASYVKNAQPSDRYYDDNAWLGISFLEAYQLTQNKKYIQKAVMLWEFIESGIDDTLDGGLYWCEQTKNSKNVCANAPAIVFALQLYEITGERNYFEQATSLYEWSQAHLQDPRDHLYYDRIDLFRSIDHAKFSYNTGQMMQAAVLFYKHTGDMAYLEEARNLAAACYNYFFTGFTSPTGETFNLLKKADIWFSAVMMRGYIELYRIDKDKKYLDAYRKNLDHAWQYARDKNGLFNVDLSGVYKDDTKWLLTQAAMVEMYGRLSVIN